MQSKWIILGVIWIMLTNVSFAQNFDDFTLDKEVSIFIKEHFEGLRDFDLGIKCPYEENQWYLDSLEYSPWFVGDFNKDNISDLFITGREKKDQTHYVVFGKDELDDVAAFELLQLLPPRKLGDLVIPFVEETKQRLYIVFKQFKTKTTTIVRDGQEVRLPKTYKDYYKMGLMKKDTLVYQFGNFIEYNASPDPRAIKFIQMHMFCQFGGCPDFRMKVSSDGQMLLHNIKNTDEEVGKYSSICEPETLDQILAMANYLPLSKKLEKFGEDSADKTVTMIVEYEDGSYKSWYDYEHGAKLGMTLLYELMIKAKQSADWELHSGE